MNSPSWTRCLAPADLARLQRSTSPVPPDLSRCAVLSLGSTGGATGDAAVIASEHVRSAARTAGRPVLDATSDRPGPSAFFGTALLAQLLPLRADTVVIIGGTATSSMRATVVDGYSYGLRVVVVEPSVTDDSEVARAYSLYDVMLHYGAVLDLGAALAGLGVPAQGDEHQHDHDHHHHHHHHHGNDHGHVVRQAADGHGTDALPDLALPRVLRRELPLNARPVSMSEYPVHGQVLIRAGHELLDAAGKEMSAGFAELPHAIAVLTADTLDPDDDPRYREALRVTEGGAILIGVGYREFEPPAANAAYGRDSAAVTERASSVNAGQCPECGSIEHSIDEVLPVNVTKGLDTGIIVFVCDSCGAAWDVPFSPEQSHTAE